ncbi:CubicO group peptidase, beta-lactamase class C family [Dyadobacter koreensis]|uniref:CubicO group peptidase, beta-lactamase class C family n=1 Tax=Dyadobacter koreensis TaxID=408657 RepID=A0A1H6YQ02_9BACT|nr:serine hydrolase [Dyadobacter koreensis]SEJ43361.1 CubicO group peptidase, beta-lactamase class C family [Dyadobacter koreensis]
MKSSLLLIFMLAALTSFGQKKITAKQIREFDQYVEKVRNEWEVPGLSIAVVKDNQVIFKKGYGVRELGKTEPVTTQTLFACASTTKAMTVALLGMLVDEGKIKWSDPVSKYLPELRLYDPYVTQVLTVRDLLIHDTGVGGTDFFTGAMSISVNEMFERMKLVKPSYPFRNGFVYQNIMYSAAGRIIERLTGKLWSEVIQERIFDRLGMIKTAPKRKFIRTENVTRPHFRIKDTIRVIDYGADSEIGSAGAVWSSADDISKWVICMLDSSKYEGGRLLKPETWMEIFKPQTFFPESEYPTMQLLKPNWRTYGLGWYQHDYKGKKINFHTGSLAGLTAITGQLPDEKLGVFIFGNYDHAEVRHVLLYKTFDFFALGENRDWNSEFKKLYADIALKSKTEKQGFESARVVDTSPTLPLDQYAGEYSSALFGEAVISVNGKILSANVNNVLKTKLSHWHYDTFRGPYEKAWHGDATAQFKLNVSGKVESLVIDGMEFIKQ